MPEQGARNDSLRRCFLLAPPGAAATTVAKVLIDRGVECLRPEDLLQPGSVWSDELTKHLTSADFVVAIVPPSASANIAFELGLAHGLSKPALVVAVGNAVVPEALRGLAVARIASLSNISDAIPEIDRFLRHGQRLAPAKHPAATGSATGLLDWARTKLTTIRRESGQTQEFALEALIEDIFKQAGAEVQHADAPSPSGDVDLVVWSDDLAYELGGPILVKCKTFGGSTGSVVRNAEHAVRRLDDIVGRSDVKLAMLVFDHDRLRDVPRIADTPRALALPIEPLINVIEQGALTEEVLKRRRQAAYARGHLGAAGAQ